ncbi:MAG: hypothetical protein IKM46_06900 [Clostridia bacterium]|nr:hypothetical protein [Clostridia bacterium]
MKKFARILALVLVAVMTLSLVACGGLESKLAGEWKGTVKESGISASVTFNFDDDKKELTMTVSVLGIDQDTTVDYEVDGDTLLIDGEEVEYEFDGNDKLVIESEGSSFKLERVK